MAEKKKEEKKYKGGPKRKSYLQSLAGKPRGRAGSEYLKYSDVDPKLIHEGVVNYRGTDYFPDSSSIGIFSTSVYRGEGKEYFMYPGNPGGKHVLWKAPLGVNAQRVQT